MADDNFSPTFMRNATAFGASPRMRFDIVLNNLAGLSWTTGKIAMVSDGTPWRPLVHALDIGQAIRRVLAAPRDLVHNEVFNVGSSDRTTGFGRSPRSSGTSSAAKSSSANPAVTTGATVSPSRRSTTSCRVSPVTGMP